MRRNEACDLPVAQHRRAVLLEEPRQRVSERPRAAARDRPAAPLPTEDDRVGVDARAGGIERHECLEGLPDHERADVPVLELASDHVPRRDRVAPQPDASARVVEQHLLQRRAEARRRDACPTEDALDLVVLGDEAPVSLRIPPRESRQLLAGPVEVEPHRQLLAVRERDVSDRVRLEVLEAIVGVQPELVVHKQRVHADDRVSCRAGVDPVAGAEQLLGRGAASWNRAGIEDEALVAGLREVRRRDEAVVAAPRHYDVRGLRHVMVSSLRADSSPSRRSALPARIAASTSGARPSARTVSTCSGSPMSKG